MLTSDAAVLLTLGERGSIYSGNGETVRRSAYPVNAVDTTAAGDTFTGYFVAALSKGFALEKALKYASAAAAIAVSSPGAAQSIPYMEEVEAFLLKNE